MKRPQLKDIPERDLLEAVITRWERMRGDPRDCSQVWEILGRFPAKLVLAKMEKLARKGALGYGVSLRTAWVEDAYLEAHYPALLERNRVARGIARSKWIVKLNG